ncbi:MAG: response regulator [Pirellulales bacterium]|nr:response regulator [Pirellulales bacterium]
MPRILLTDDEVHILRAAEFKLQRAGYDVVCAGDGEEAWASILQQLPDLVVTDCQMPRLDGFGLCRRIRENPATRQLPIIMLTAKGFEIAADALAEKYGVRELIDKPFSPRELLKVCNEILRPAGVAVE